MTTFSLWRPARVAALLATLTVAVAAQAPDRTGILLLAHGGKPDWNQRVTAIAHAIDPEQPTEVAFGMATRPNIQGAVDRLVARGARRIVAVPLFVSSHSSVVTATAYLLGLRQDMPPDLTRFARMNHGPAPAATGAGAGHNGAAHHDAAAGHHAAPAEDNTRPVVSPVPIVMTSALNAHPLVAAILTDRAKALSRTPSGEAVVLVAHGPVPDDDNARWLADMKVLADGVRSATTFASIDYLTVRDDAPKPIRDRATEELRAIVQARLAEGRRVLIVPLLLSYGGIEQGIRERLKGLDYSMAEHALTPDERITQWVRESARTAELK